MHLSEAAESSPIGKFESDPECLRSIKRELSVGKFKSSVWKCATVGLGRHGKLELYTAAARN